jgi:hypothetical protein
VEAPRKVSVSKQSELSFQLRSSRAEESKVEQKCESKVAAKIELKPGHVLITDDMFFSKAKGGKRSMQIKQTPDKMTREKSDRSEGGTKRKEPKLSLGSASIGKLSAFFSKKSPVKELIEEASQEQQNSPD